MCMYIHAFSPLQALVEAITSFSYVSAPKLLFIGSNFTVSVNNFSEARRKAREDTWSNQRKTWGSGSYCGSSGRWTIMEQS